MKVLSESFESSCAFDRTLVEKRRVASAARANLAEANASMDVVCTPSPAAARLHAPGSRRRGGRRSAQRFIGDNSVLVQNSAWLLQLIA